MSTYSTTVLEHYADAPAAVRSALAAALADAEKAVAGVAAPSTKGTKRDPLKDGVQASEQTIPEQYAAMDTFFSKAAMSADAVYAELCTQLSEAEGTTYGAAMDRVRVLCPKLYARYTTERYR